MSSRNFGLAPLVFLLSLSASSTSPPSTLQHVNLLYRHGDRTPTHIYPKDIHQADAWPEGLGWLTNIGKQQQYKLGQYLRDRYGGFINVTHYDHTQIAVEASAVNRCLMSAYSNLAGLFPPQGDQVWKQDLPWQPIPVHSRPIYNDNKLAMTESCPRYQQLLAEQFTSQRVLDFATANKAFFKMVSNATGWTESVTDIWRVSDALECELAHNMTWNEWARPDGVFDKLIAITLFGWETMYYTPEMAKLQGGPLLKEMIENMEASSNGTSGNLKLHMYSAHDTTVAALLKAMMLFNDKLPPYRTLVMVELHKVDDQDVVKVFLRNDTTKDPFYLRLKGCEDPCKLSTFRNVLSARIPQDWNQECQLHTNSAIAHLSPASWIALVLGVALLGTIIAGVVIMARRRSGSHQYVKV